MLPRSTKKRKRIRNWAQKQYVTQIRHNIHFARSGLLEFLVVLDQLKPSFTIGKIFRSEDDFGARSIHLI